LRRRSQKDRTTWTKMDKLAERWLPKPRISHPWPSQRFRVKHPKWSRMRNVALTVMWRCPGRSAAAAAERFSSAT
jgi:hypothetical protein